jgi:hypothetical protein
MKIKAEQLRKKVVFIYPRSQQYGSMVLYSLSDDSGVQDQVAESATRDFGGGCVVLAGFERVKRGFNNVSQPLLCCTVLY